MEGLSKALQSPVTAIASEWHTPLSLRAILALIGFSSVIAQIVLMRELIVVFYGNEISLGLMLANWLVWTAVGSSLVGRCVARTGEARRTVTLLQIITAVALPLTIVAVRISRTLLRPLPGELLGPGNMLLTSFLVLSLFCTVSGGLFAAGSKFYADQIGASTARATSSVYLLEAIGSGLGGILASVVLIRFLNAFDIAALVALLNLLAAVAVVSPTRPIRWVVVVVIGGAFALFVFPQATRWLERLSLSYLWKGFRVIESRNSVYGNLVVVETDQSRSLYENGLVFSTVPDPAAAEEAVHYALLQHPRPRSLLLIGGGVSGSVAEAFRHQTLTSVDYVELDPTVIALARRHFPQEWSAIEADSRVRVHHLDGRLFLKTTTSSFDIIIVNLPDPQTAQLNRFYTVEFFREAAARLNPGGVLSFQVTGAENYINDPLAEFLRCLNRTLRAVFPEVTFIPGATIHFFAATRRGVLTSEPAVVVERLRARQLGTIYVREYFLPFRMSSDRMLNLRSLTEPDAATPVNRDFAPIAYYFDMALWSSQFDRGLASLLQSMASARFASLVVVMAGALFGLVGVMQRRRSRAGSQQPRTDAGHRATAGFAVVVMGFTLLALEILLLLGFQAVHGYVYHQLAIVVGAFMMGMALGSWWVLRPSGGIRQAQEGAGSNQNASEVMTARINLRKLAVLQLAAALSPLVLYALLGELAQVHSRWGLLLVSQVLFPLLALMAGMLGGAQFPIATRIYFLDLKDTSRSPGALYALDLVGASLGAVALSIYLLPVLGFLRAAALIMVANLAPAAAAALAARGVPTVRLEPAPQAGDLRKHKQ